MIIAAPTAVGSGAIGTSMNGPLRSTAIDAPTTMIVVVAILKSKPGERTRRTSVRTTTPPSLV
jgi:hypothetical protein